MRALLPQTGRVTLSTIALCAALVVPFSLRSPVAAASTGHAADRSDALQLTDELRGLASELREHPGRVEGLRARVRDVAAQRRSALLQLMTTSPDTVAATLLDASDRAVVGAVDAQDVEASVTMNGALEVIAGQNTTQHYLLRNGQAPLSILSNGQLPGLSQHNVTLSGSQLGSTVFVEAASGSAGTAVAGATPSAGMLGPIKAAVIVSYFSDTTNPFSVPAIQATFNGHPGADVDSFFNEVSYGQTSLVPSFFGPYQLPVTQSSACGSLSTLAQDSMAAAAASVAFANVQRLIYVVDCPNLGSWAGVGSYSVNTPQGAIQASESWIQQGSETSTYGYDHELGHNAGFQHADWAVCNPDAFDPPSNFGPNCPLAPYGDTFDTMGSAPYQWQQTPDYGAYHKSLAGWLSAANLPTVSAPGTSIYTLSPLESASSGPIALEIPRGDSGTSFTVEYRQPIGFDSWLSTCYDVCNVTQGASIKLVGGFASGADVHAIDTTPGSQPSSGYWDERDFYRDQALTPGRTFTDPEYGIQITSVSTSSAGLTIQVTIPTQMCMHTSPSVAATPVATTVAPGQTATWSLTVHNNYSSGCPPAQFRFRSYGMHGANPYTDPGLFTLASGSSTTLQMSLPVPQALAYGAYSDQAAILANAIADRGTSLAYSFTVGGASDTSAPTPPQHLSATAAGAHLVTLHWLPGSDPVGVGGYDIYRNDTLIAGPLATTAYLDTSVAPSTLYTYRVDAVNDGGVASAYSNTTSATTPAVTDTTPPSDVPGVAVNRVGDHSVQLSWRPAADNVGVAYYRVVHDSLPVDVPPTTTSLTINDLWSSIPTSFYVIAHDADGNTSNLFSAINSKISLTTAASGSTAPLAPQQPQATDVSPAHAVLAWPAVAGATQYTVYRNLIPLASVPSPAYTDAAVWPGGSEIYTVTASDSSGNASGASQQNVVNIPQARPGATSPVASVLAPLAGSIATGVITVSGTASDPSGIAGVQLVVDGVPGTTLNAAPFIFSLDSAALSNGLHTLQLVVSARDGYVGSSAVVSVTASNLDTTAPTAPPLLQAVSAGSTAIDLAWAPSSDNVGVAAYRVWRNGIQVGAPATATFADTGLAPATAYTYQVQAVDGAGNASALSGAASATTLPADGTPPTAPASLTASASSTSSITLTWSASSDNVGVAGYTVYRSQLSGVYVKVAAPSATSFTVTDSGLTPGTAYSYYVQASDAAGNVSSQSPTATATTPLTIQPPPTPPSALSATAQSPAQIALTWGASSDPAGVTAYDVYRSSTGSASALIASVPGSTTAFTDSSLAAATTYSYDVVARDAAGLASSPSNTASATTPAADTQPPTSPSGVAVTSTTSSTIALGWGASTDDVGVTWYGVYRASGAAPFAAVATLPSSATAYTDSGLAAGTSYTYYVVAGDAAGYVSTPSNQVTATTPTPMGTVSGAVSTNGGMVAGATVSVALSSSTATATTSASGWYALTSLPAGTWTLSVSARHYATVRVSVTVTPGATTTQNVTLVKSR